jgi:putative NADPH-quinone reductase
MPAILKGWVDRVIKNGIAFTFVQDEEGNEKRIKLVKLKTAVVINTANSSEKREESLGFPLQNLWQKSIFRFLKVNDFHRKTFAIVSESTLEERTEWLNETERYIKELFPKD